MYFYYTAVPFEKMYLELLKKGNPPRRLYLMEKICPKWRDMGTLLGVEHLDTIDTEKRGNHKDCCYSVIEKWFDKGSQRYSVNWKGMLELLDDLQMSRTVEELKEMLSNS